MRPALTRASIVTAARELLVAEGLEAVSLRRIAAHLGVTAPALYAYVTDKLDLLRAIASLEIDELVRRFNALDEDDAVDRLRRMSEVYADYVRENPELFRAMFLTRPELTAQPFGGQKALGERILDAVTTAMHAAVEQERIETDDTPLAALTFWSSVHGAVVTLTSGPLVGRDHADPLVRSVARAALIGLGARDNVTAGRHN